MRCIEIFVVFAMGTLDFAIVSRSVRLYQFVPYTIMFEARLKQCRRGLFRTSEPLCKLCSVVGLNAFYPEFKGFEHMFKEHCRAV